MNEQYLGVNGQMVTVGGKAVKMPQGVGDMQSSVYDPNNKHQDIFAYVDNAIKDVTVIPTIPTTTSLIKGNGSGGLVAATRGSDYIASGNIVKQTLVSTESTPTEDYAINWVYG